MTAAGAEPRKLYRDFQNGWVGGVAAGLAEYAGMDPLVVRILFIVITIVTAFIPMALIYLVMWALVPPKPPAFPPPVSAGVAPPRQQS